jgi:hypothetical protein
MGTRYVLKSFVIFPNGFTFVPELERDFDNDDDDDEAAKDERNDESCNKGL